MGEQTPSKEERILRAVKQTLTSVARDTATEPGMKHPLTESTIDDIRHCLLLISQREQELVEARGGSMAMRPQMPGDRDPQPQGDVVVPIDSITRRDKA